MAPSNSMMTWNRKNSNVANVLKLFQKLSSHLKEFTSCNIILCSMTGNSSPIFRQESFNLLLKNLWIEAVLYVGKSIIKGNSFNPFGANYGLSILCIKKSAFPLREIYVYVNVLCIKLSSANCNPSNNNCLKHHILNQHKT